MSEDLITTAPASALAAFAEPNGLDPFIDAVKKIVSEFKHDLSTGVGRKKTASLAAKVSSFKVSMDEMGKSLTEDWKQKSKVVDQVRKKMRDELDSLRDEARRPLTEWEDKEKARVARIKAKIEEISVLAYEVIGENLTVTALESRLFSAMAYDVDDSFEEFKREAVEARLKSIDRLKNNLGKAKLAESQRIELERLRAESEARAKAEREESLRKEGELRAQREAEAKAEAEQAKAIEEAERKELEAIRLSESNAKALREAEERARMAEINARRKAEAEARAIEEEKARREADAAHNKKIKRQAKESLLSLGIDEKICIQIVLAIDAGKINNVTINY